MIELLFLNLLNPSIFQDVAGSLEDALEIAAGGFSFLLFALSIYAFWRRGKQPTLLIVSIAFLMFFLKQVFEFIPISILHSELISSAMDFFILALFFVALVVRPRRRNFRKQAGPEEAVEE